MHRFIILGLAIVLLQGCITQTLREGGIAKPVKWSTLKGWSADRQAQVLPALQQSCVKLALAEAWREICDAAHKLNAADDNEARVFFESWFVPHAVVGTSGKKGLITGYYEPLLYGSLQQDKRFKFPIYQQPDDLLTIDLGSVYPELKGKRVRGRLLGRQVVPYLTRSEIDARSEIDGDHSPLSGSEIVWVDDLVSLFFLHIQGSGRIQLTDGSLIAVGYADQNGHPYVSIGSRLIQMKEIAREDVSLGSIRRWISEHPEQTRELLYANPSYVFFSIRDSTLPGPLGAQNVPLTAERSIAVDKNYIPLGVPVWLDTTLPENGQDYQRLVIAQDTGGAITGAVRADVFFGQGQRAENLAGNMKQQGQLIVLLPKPINR